jgi:PPOX class probable F420-dependent enzyme
MIPHPSLTYPGTVSDDWIARFASLLSAAAPAVLTTYRRDGSAVASPVWFRFKGDAFEVAIAQDDVKLRYLAARPACSLVVFEVEPPFRGIRVEGTPELVHGDAAEVRASIAGRYLGPEAGRRFAEERRVPGVVLRLTTERARIWDLDRLLPAP